MNFLIDSKILYPNENGYLYEKKSLRYLLSLLFRFNDKYNLNINNVIDLCSFGKIYRLHTLLKWYLLGKPYYKIFLISIDKNRDKYSIIYFTLSFSLKNWYLLFISLEIYEVMYIGRITSLVKTDFLDL